MHTYRHNLTTGKRGSRTFSRVGWGLGDIREVGGMKILVKFHDCSRTLNVYEHNLSNCIITVSLFSHFSFGLIGVGGWLNNRNVPVPIFNAYIYMLKSGVEE